MISACSRHNRNPKPKTTLQTKIEFLIKTRSMHLRIKLTKRQKFEVDRFIQEGTKFCIFPLYV